MIQERGRTVDGERAVHFPNLAICYTYGMDSARAQDDDPEEDEDDLEVSPYYGYEPGSGNLPPKIGWEAPEYYHHQHGADWYWAFGLATIALVALGVYLHDVLLSALVVIAAIAVLLYIWREPLDIPVELDTRGIKMGRYLYPYVNLDAFWITTHDINRKIIIRPRKRLMTWVVIPIPDDVDEHIIRDYLLRYVREEEQEEPLIDLIMERLRF